MATRQIKSAFWNIDFSFKQEDLISFIMQMVMNFEWIYSHTIFSEINALLVY